MAFPSPSAVAGQKRGPGRPPKALQHPMLKRQKRSSLDHEDTKSVTSTDEPQLDILEEELKALPSKVSSNAPLPTLSEAQSLSVSDEEYASVAKSAVLAASLDKSRASWTSKGVFDRYWVKPETGKHAKPTPVNNPELKTMKSRGKCRLRIEPHIFEVEVWVVEKPRPSTQAKQFAPKPTTQWQSQQSASTEQDKKASPDPVIGMLATRAGSDPELKALMREVAAGNASQEQLKVFQKHIDELSTLLTAQKAQEERKKTKEVAAYQQPNTQYAQQRYVPPTPLPGEVVFAFTTSGSTPDRFLFPQHCILEHLTPQHLLASFIVTYDDPEKLQQGFDTKFWVPVTMMVEVAYGREGILKDIQRWVKPANESKEHMAGIISSQIRAPNRHLALRLPFKSSSGKNSQPESKVGTPVSAIVEEKKKRGRKSIVSAHNTLDIKESRATAVGPGVGTAASAKKSGGNADRAQRAGVTEQNAVETYSMASKDSEQTRSTRATRRSLRGTDG